MHIQPLRDGIYRVNVYVGTNASNFKIPYSRSVVADDEGVVADDEGKVLSSSPTIYKLY